MHNNLTSQLSNFLRYWSASLLVILSAGLLTACSIPSGYVPLSGNDSWKEEVLLHDGRKMVLERTQSYGGRSEPGQSGPIGEYTIRFTLPNGGKTFAWTSDYDQKIGRTNFLLLAVHVKGQVPYIVAEPNLCPSYNKWGRPNPPYVIFRFDGSAWLRIPLEQLPIEFTTNNVLRSVQHYDAQRWSSMGAVSADVIAKETGTSRNPFYRSILREPFSQERIVEMCGDMVPYRGKWVLRNDPVARDWKDRELLNEELSK